MKRNFCFLLVPCLLCSCSLFDNTKLQLSEHQLVLEPGQSHVLEIQWNKNNRLVFRISDREIIDIDLSNHSITAKKEGRSTLIVTQKRANKDTCDVVVRYNHIEPTEPLNVATIAHKGYHVDAIENTAEAFSEAGRRNFFGIETDIHRTLDGRWVCNHDNKVKGMSKNISECTFEEIMAVNLSNNPNETIRVCTFENYLDICYAYNKHPVIEIKESTSKEKLEEIITELRSYDIVNDVIFISKLGDVLGSLLNIKNECGFNFDLQMLTEGNGWQYVSEFLNVSSQYEAITPDMAKSIRLTGQYVAAWTVNDRDVANSLIDMGVKYITTDIFECTDQFIDNSLFGI